MPISSWTTHPQVISKHMIMCARCRSHASEQATIEAFTVLGQGYWSLCRRCMVDFNIFIRNGGLLMNVQELIDVYAISEDVDIAEHHALCQCIDCRIFDAMYEVDADEIVKGWKEDNYIYSDVVEKSA